jgi:catechol 2,3-dioxygenase
MTRSGEKGESIYPRGWDDLERYSLKLTASIAPSSASSVRPRTSRPVAFRGRIFSAGEGTLNSGSS